MAIVARGDVAVIVDGDYVTILIAGKKDLAHDFRGMAAGVLEMVGDSLSEESRQRLEDVHAALNRALGGAVRPIRQRLPSEA